MDLRDGDTKSVRNLLAYRKVGVEGQTRSYTFSDESIQSHTAVCFARLLDQATRVKESLL
jgi:hypothetical protein